MSKYNIIYAVEAGSIADELGIEPGDVLMSVNGMFINDIFDYRFQINDEFIELEVVKGDGSKFICEIEKEFNEDLGIEFESGLMDKSKSCNNRCIFCFIDQLPKNMRESLYFKDDDTRLSFLTGNYVTLTNMTDEDIDRIAFYHLSPINISVHATDKDVRVKMLRNPKAANIIKYIERFVGAGIELNCQVVLCKGINDGDVLDNTIRDLSRFLPSIKSLSVVPVGLTKFRDGLFSLEPFFIEDALKVLFQINNWQQRFLEASGSRFVFAADEFYLKAGMSFPDYKEYEDFPQLENGVGMISLFEWEFNCCFDKILPDDRVRYISIATGEAAVRTIENLCDKIKMKFVNVNIKVYAVKNNFFGEHITVSGLLCGVDIVNALKEMPLGNKLLIPPNALRDNTDVLLDNMDIKWIENELDICVDISGRSGSDFLKSILEENYNAENNSCNCGTS